MTFVYLVSRLWLPQGVGEAGSHGPPEESGNLLLEKQMRLTLSSSGIHGFLSLFRLYDPIGEKALALLSQINPLSSHDAALDCELGKTVKHSRGTFVKQSAHEESIFAIFFSPSI